MNNPSFMKQPMSRRALFAGGLGVAATATLAACSSPAPSGGGGGGSSTPSSGGRLRVGYLGGSGADAIDPILTTGSPDTVRMRQVYDNLTRYNEDGVVEPFLAEEFIEEDPFTWTIKLRQDVTFHHGKTLDADDVVFSLQRLLGPESHNATGAAMIDPEGIEKVDDYTIRLKLARPAYYLMEALTMPATSIVPVDFDPANPVGTGPFSLVSFTPGQQVVFARNDDYWRGAPYLDEVEVTTFSDESARINALQSGQIDAAPLVAASYASVIESAGGIHIFQYPGGRFENFVLQTQSAEFSNPEVRRAMRLLLNRQQIVDQVYSGRAVIGNDVPEPTSVFYNDSLPQWEQNVEEGMAMLRSAGAADMQLELVTAPLTTTMVNAAEVYVQQLVEAGVDARISQIDAGAFYGPGFGERPFTQDIWGGWTFPAFTDMALLPGASFNETAWDNSDFASAFEAASLTSDLDERKQHLWDAQEILHTDGGTIIPAFMDVLDGYSDKVDGYKSETLGMGGGDFDYTETYFVE